VLKIPSEFRAIADIKTSLGHIYLRPLRAGDIIFFEKLDIDGTANKFRAFLPNIGSLAVESDGEQKHIPLDPEIIDKLLDSEVEQLAEAYEPYAREMLADRSQEHNPIVRQGDETASDYFVRLFEHELQRKKLRNDKFFRPTQGMFDQIRTSAFSLGTALNAHEKLIDKAKQEPTSPESVYVNPSTIFQEFQEQSSRHAHERAGDREMLRSMSVMATESAHTLKVLAETATTLMEQLEERAYKTDNSTRKQITIALLAVCMSVLLNFCTSLENRGNHIADSQWQQDLLIAIKQGNQQYPAIRREIQETEEKIDSDNFYTTGVNADNQGNIEEDKDISEAQPIESSNIQRNDGAN